MERRRTIDVADQADRRRVEIVGDRHALLFRGVDDRLDRQVIVQRLATSAMDVPDRRTDLRIVVGVDVFLEEVDEPAIALQDRQDPQVGPGRRLREQRLDPRREVRFREDPPERPECQDKSIQFRNLVDAKERRTYRDTPRLRRTTSGHSVYRSVRVVANDPASPGPSVERIGFSRGHQTPGAESDSRRSRIELHPGRSARYDGVVRWK